MWRYKNLLCILTVIFLQVLVRAADDTDMNVDLTADVENQYIITFKSGVSDIQFQSHFDSLSSATDDSPVKLLSCKNASSGKAQDCESKISIGKLKMMTVKVTSESELEALRNDEDIESIEQDSVVTTSVTCTDQAASSVYGLDLTDSNDGTQFIDNVYNHDSTGGTGVRAYIIDSGIARGHIDFGNRAEFLWACSSCGGDGDADSAGHGTHVAGTVGSNTYGVAKQVTLMTVRVFGTGDSTSTSIVIAGINMAVSDAVNNGSPSKSVINMSLGGSSSSSLISATEAAVAAGVTVVVAAGNSDTLACRQSPANAPNAITVAAVDSSRTRASFSNFGSCVDIHAPGVSVRSVSRFGGSRLLSGTSMSSPHVAGAVAVFLSQQTGRTPAQVREWLREVGAQGAVTDGCGSPDLLLQLPCDNSAWSPGNSVSVPPATGCSTPTPSTSCFHGDSIVFTENMEKIQMRELNIGDKVLTVSDSGGLRYEPVIVDVHRDAHLHTWFYKIQTQTHEIMVTPKHFLYIGDTVESSQLVKVDDVRVGDSLIVNTNSTLGSEKITHIEFTYDRGIYNPLVSSGRILVNNILASVYADDFPSVKPKYLHSLLWCNRMLSSMKIDIFNVIEEKSGMPYWAAYGEHMLQKVI